VNAVNPLLWCRVDPKAIKNDTARTAFEAAVGVRASLGQGFAQQIPLVGATWG
jgi:hypothetical protein